MTDSWIKCYSPIEKQNLLPVGDPIYTGSDVCVIKSLLKCQSTDEDPLGCIVYHAASPTIAESMNPELSFQENLVEALLGLLHHTKYKTWLRESGRSLGSGGACFICEVRGKYRYAFRVSEDYELLYCPVCESYFWQSTYQPPRKNPPFELRK